MSRAIGLNCVSRFKRQVWLATSFGWAGCAGDGVDEEPNIQLTLSFRYVPQRVKFEVVDGRAGELEVDSGLPLRLSYGQDMDLFVRCEQARSFGLECKVRVVYPSFEDTCAAGPAFRVSTDVNPNPFLVHDWCPGPQVVVVP